MHLRWPWLFSALLGGNKLNQTSEGTAGWWQAKVIGRALGERIFSSKVVQLNLIQSALKLNQMSMVLIS